MIPNSSRHPHVVVSIASVSDRNPTPPSPRPVFLMDAGARHPERDAADLARPFTAAADVC